MTSKNIVICIAVRDIEEPHRMQPASATHDADMATATQNAEMAIDSRLGLFFLNNFMTHSVHHAQ
jgi:hypothetical protein